jgi:hypothetical protein
MAERWSAGVKMLETLALVDQRSEKAAMKCERGSYLTHHFQPKRRQNPRLGK